MGVSCTHGNKTCGFGKRRVKFFIEHTAKGVTVGYARTNIIGSRTSFVNSIFSF